MDETIEYVDFKFEEIVYKTTLTKKFANRKPHHNPDSRKVFAFIPGTILKVLVKEGAKVKKGDPLVILQAMKMDNSLLATRPGVVKKTYVKQGDTVQKNCLLLELK
ncbi:MAG: acetyl-CoA carboxylase biotin carboxyl carrier protein subunit [Bacteroidales bacterium]|nr:acetyl-CoA carboxylase biotin carboxyl carrier protein subunit [Bacteroidales bacterium]